MLTPLAVGPGQPFPYISGLSLSLGVIAVDPDSGEERFARVKVPEGLDRFVAVGKRLVPLELVIAHFLPMLFPGMEIAERAAFRVTRDADFEVSDDADDLLEAVESELRNRRFGDVVRLELTASASARLRDRLMEGLGVRRRPGVRDRRARSTWPTCGSSPGSTGHELKDEPWVPGRARRAGPARRARPGCSTRSAAPTCSSTTRTTRSAPTFETLAQAAARDPDVIAIKTTVYRTSDDSTLVSSLIDCAEDGKQSVCLVELKARFDERRNIEWSRAMEQAGVHVVHGFPDLKIHAKMTLIVRREKDGLRRYVHIGTGNYNASTARLYEDLGLFTADPEIAADVADLFNYVTGFGRPQQFRQLLVAPFGAARPPDRGDRPGRRGRARRQACPHPAQAERAGRPADHRGAVRRVRRRRATSRSARARSACSAPACPGSPRTIHVRSIVGRFLEHSRVYWFETGDEISVWLGSADLMPRNLDRRIEVLVPVDAARPRQELGTVLDSVFADTTNAWALDPDGEWSRVEPTKRKPHSHQAAMMRRARQRARRRRT